MSENKQYSILWVYDKHSKLGLHLASNNSTTDEWGCDTITLLVESFFQALPSGKPPQFILIEETPEDDFEAEWDGASQTYKLQVPESKL